jgi:hypothetical protein
VLFRFREGLTEDQRDGFHAAASGLGTEIPAVSVCTAGPALRLQADSFDYALMLDFVDAEAFAAYKRHPAHLRLIEDHIRPCVETTVRAQVVVTGADGS